MKTIGLIGGMSWESSAEYYRIINETVRDRLGGFHSADCLMYSVDFDEIETLQMTGRWDDAAEILIDAARRLEAGGADCVVLCTNTMHKVAGAIQEATELPLIHIADATANAIRARSMHTVGLLGTVFTMEEMFYRGRLMDRFGLEILLPDAPQRAEVSRVIYEELVHGRFLMDSRNAYIRIIEALAQRGAQGVILGCTEIGLLVKPDDSPIPVFDTTYIHAVAAVDFALG